jgi:NADH-quinone oxidoreductase subunit M
MHGFDDWALTLAVFLPLAGAVVMMLIPRAHEDLHKMVALVSTVATAGVGVAILWRFDYHHHGLQFAPAPKNWIEVIHARYQVGIDGLSLPLLLLSMAICVLVILYSWNHFPEPHNPKAFLLLILVLEVGMNGTFVAQDLILFFVFFEVVLLPMYFMIGVWGGEQRQYAAILYFKGGESFSIPYLIQHAQAHIDHNVALVIFGGLFMGFAIKVPMFPFHTWLPDAHTQAPTQGSVILAAVLLKLGTYGFIRIAIPILPDAAHSWAPWIGGLAVVGIIYGSLGCLAQTDMKRLIAFSSVAHMGFVMLGIATLTDFGINAAVFGMVAHGLITGMLFFIAGSVKDRFHTLDMKRLGGLLLQAPRMGWILGFCAMASLGLPGLAGFWGEFPAILAAYNPAPGLSAPLFRTYMVIASVGTVFAAGYLLWMLQRVAFGTPKEEWAGHDIGDMQWPEYVAWVPLLAGIVVLGLIPALLFNITDPAVQVLTAAIGK